MARSKIHRDLIAVSDRNVIINGNFDIWQRGTSFAAATSGSYSADRWKYGKVGAAVHTISRDTSVPTVDESNFFSNYSLKMAVTTLDSSIAAGDLSYISYPVEGYDWTRLARRPFTLSFWVRGTKTGIHCVSFRNNDTADRSYIAEYTINAADTWERKTITVSPSPAT